MSYHCRYCNWKNQTGGLRGKDERQVFYGNLASLAYQNTTTRKSKAPKRFSLDESLSNPDVAVYFNPSTKEVVSSVVGTRFDDKKNRFRDLRSDVGIIAGTDRFGSRTKEVGSVIKQAKAKYKDYDQVCTGHSLGARVCRNVSKQTGVKGVLFNQGSSPLGAVTDKVAKMFGKDHKDSKTYSHTTGNDVISKSAQVFNTDTDSTTVKMKDGVKKGLLTNRSIDNFTGGKKKSAWIDHVKA